MIYHLVCLEVILLLVVDAVLRTAVLQQRPVDEEATCTTTTGTTHSLRRIEIERALVVLGGNELVFAIIKGIDCLIVIALGTKHQFGRTVAIDVNDGITGGGVLTVHHGLILVLSPHLVDVLDLHTLASRFHTVPGIDMVDGEHSVDIVFRHFHVLAILGQTDVHDALRMIRRKETGETLLGFQDTRSRIEIVESHHGLHLR